MTVAAVGVMSCGVAGAQDVVIPHTSDVATPASVQEQSITEDQRPMTVFLVNTRATTVSVVVTGEKGKPVAELRREDFKYAVIGGGVGA